VAQNGLICAEVPLRSNHSFCNASVWCMVVQVSTIEDFKSRLFLFELWCSRCNTVAVCLSQWYRAVRLCSATPGDCWDNHKWDLL